MNIKLLLILLLLAPIQAQAEKWYELEPTNKVVAEFALKSGAVEIIKIKAQKPTMVGFMAKITPKQMQYYKSKNIKPITVAYKPEKITMFGYGGGQAVMPINGIIELEIKNHTNEKILVDIFSGK